MITKQQHTLCRRTRRILSLLCGAMLSVGGLPTSVSAQATPPEVMTIVEQLKVVFEPTRPSIRKVEISVSTHKGTPGVQWVAGEVRKQLADGKRTLLVMLEPESVRGNALLIQERGDEDDTMWVYSPSVQRVRGIVPVDAYERFLATDFTYADLGFVSRRSTYRLLGEEERAGVRAYKVEEVPQEQWYYSRILTWVAVDSLLPLQRDYYDRAGDLWKTEIFDQVTVIDGVPTPLRIRMVNVQQNTTTEFKMSEVRYDADVPDELFDPQRLPQAVTSPLWRPYGAQPAAGT